MQNKALLVVDIQNDFCPGGALEVQKGDAIIDSVTQPLCTESAEVWMD